MFYCPALSKSISIPRGLILSVGVQAGLSLIVHTIINHAHPTYQGDEVCHVPQVQRFCRGQFWWDTGITTLPGTYVGPVVVFKSLQFLGRILNLNLDVGLLTLSNDPCSLYNLRLWNVIVNILSTGVLYLILSHNFRVSSGAKNKGLVPESQVALATLTLASFPLHFYFGFFFYTEPTSLFFLLLLHYFWLRGQFGLSALFGAGAVFTRQTNIVWVFWHGLMTLMDIAAQEMENSEKVKVQNVKDLNDNIKPLINSKTEEPMTLTLVEVKSVLKRIIEPCFGYILIGASFLLFVIINKGIAVGDRQSHQVQANLPQMLYFALFSGILLAPLQIIGGHGSKVTLAQVRRHSLLILLSIFIGLIIVRLNTVAHPYILIDNSHLLFHAWRALTGWSPWVKYALVPVAIWNWTFLISNLELKKEFVAGFLIACFFNLSYQLLLEFRYFIPPYLFARIHFGVKGGSWETKSLIREWGYYCLINVCSIFIFVNYETQVWIEREGRYETKRYMW